MAQILKTEEQTNEKIYKKKLFKLKWLFNKAKFWWIYAWTIIISEPVPFLYMYNLVWEFEQFLWNFHIDY